MVPAIHKVIVLTAVLFITRALITGITEVINTSCLLRYLLQLAQSRRKHLPEGRKPIGAGANNG
jgi:hypothetical protein